MWKIYTRKFLIDHLCLYMFNSLTNHYVGCEFTGTFICAWNTVNTVMKLNLWAIMIYSNIKLNLWTVLIYSNIYMYLPPWYCVVVFLSFLQCRFSSSFYHPHLSLTILFFQQLSLKVVGENDSATFKNWKNCVR